MLRRDEQLGLVAMPRQRDIARRRAPVLRMIEIGLVERAALALVDRAGIAVPKILELGGVELDYAIGRGRRAATVILLPSIAWHGAGLAVEETLRLVGAGELDAVAGGRTRRGRAGSRSS